RRPAGVNGRRLARALVVTAWVAAAAGPGRSAADETESMLAHCAQQMRAAPAAQRTAFEQLGKALNATGGDDREQGRRIAALAHDVIDAPRAPVDRACRATLANVAALAAFVGGD